MGKVLREIMPKSYICLVYTSDVYKIQIYGFATLGLSICPVKDRDEAKTKLRQDVYKRQVYNEEQGLMNYIEQMAQRSFANTELYLNRHKEFFDLYDTENSKRNYEAVKERWP